MGGGGIEKIPAPAMLLDVLSVLLNSRQLEAVDLVSLEASSSLFHAPSRIQPYESMSIAASAAHHTCQMHPVFQTLPQAQSELLARCEGSWKLVLHFLESSERSSGCSACGNACSNVLTAGGMTYSLTVNRKGELHAFGVFFEVYTFGNNTSCCCEVGESGQAILRLTLVNSLQGIACQQVAAGDGYTLAVKRAGEVYSWGKGGSGQLGHGVCRDEFRPRMLEKLDRHDPVLQVSAGANHALAVTKLGQLYSWGEDFDCKMRPCRIEHGGFDKLFTTSAAIVQRLILLDVFTWGLGIHSALGREDVVEYQDNPLLVDILKGSRAIQIVAGTTTCVLLDNGTIHCFWHLLPRNWGIQWQPSHGRIYSESYVLDAHNAHSIDCGPHHVLVATEKGSVFRFGSTRHCQLGAVNVGPRETLSLIRAPTEVLTAVTELEIDAEVSDGGEL